MSKDSIGILVLGLVISVVIAIGFSIAGSPTSKRLVTLDTTRLTDFGSIRSAIQKYHLDKKALPTSLDVITKDRTLSYSEFQITDPETKKPYEYAILSTTSYNLCTTFSTDTEELKEKSDKTYILTYYEGRENKTYDFEKGYNCITYVLDPLPTTKVTPSEDIPLRSTTPATSNVLKKTNQEARESIAKLLTAINLYSAANEDKLPLEISSLEVDTPTGLDSFNFKSLCSDLVPTYIQSLPTDPVRRDPDGITSTDCSATNKYWTTAFTITRKSDNKITIGAPPRVENGIPISISN